jgi:5-methyltetrahydrofolate--homocysteine methyltransferase
MTAPTEQLRNELSEALRQGLVDEAIKLTQRAINAGDDPLDLIQQVLVPTLSEVGRQFQAFEIFLPELMAAGDAAQAATQLLEAEIAAAGRQSASLGTIVLGTVQNDIHDIGKNIVKTLLSSHGFKVIDIGRDVAPSKFLEAAERENADIVAMSALMTTTRPATRSTINLFTEAGARASYKMIIGGGCIDMTWANEIGADGYAPDAAGAVDLCKQLIQR